MASDSSLSFIDTHCHLNFNEFDHDRLQVVERAWQNGILRIINPGIDIETSKSAIKCSFDHPQVFAAVGLHPNSGSSWTHKSFSELKQLAGEEKVVAIGEIGLDYYRDYTPRELQRSIFIAQLELATDLGLPVIIHNRKANNDILDIIRNWNQNLKASGSKLINNPGVMHSFSGTLEFANEMVSLNFKIGISGPVTFRKAQTLQSVVNALPLESILLETDSPYLSPHPIRGKRNEPTNVRIVAGKIAEIKMLPIDKVAKITSKEADKLFNWRVTH